MTGRLAAASLLLLFVLYPLFSAHALSDREIVRLINNCRRNAGLKALRGNALLNRSSRLKVVEMVEQGYFGHTNPSGEPFHTNFRKAGYTYGRVGEILEMGCLHEKCVLDAWLKSTPHRQAIFDPGYREIGCSSMPAPRKGFYVVCHFGKSP